MYCCGRIDRVTIDDGRGGEIGGSGGRDGERTERRSNWMMERGKKGRGGGQWWFAVKVMCRRVQG